MIGLFEVLSSAARFFYFFPFHYHFSPPPSVALGRIDDSMEDQELTLRVKEIHKALYTDPPSNVIQLLERLKKDTAPTEEQLRVGPLPA